MFRYESTVQTRHERENDLCGEVLSEDVLSVSAGDCCGVAVVFWLRCRVYGSRPELRRDEPLEQRFCHGVTKEIRGFRFGVAGDSVVLWSNLRLHGPKRSTSVGSRSNGPGCLSAAFR